MAQVKAAFWHHFPGEMINPFVGFLDIQQQ